MSEVVVKGTLRDILSQMLRIRVVFQTRKADGWTPFQDDETWEYNNWADERLCYKCEEFGIRGEYDGDELPSNFPDLVQQNPPSYTLVRPAVHETYPELAWSTSPDAVGGCRCWMVWLDAENTLAERLAVELREVV